MTSQNRKSGGENPDDVSKMSRGANPVPGPSSQTDQKTAFRGFLLKLKGEITKADLENIKFRLRGRPGIGRAEIEECSSAFDLFALLETRGCLSVNNTVILRQLCRDNVKLVEILNDYEKGGDCDREGPFTKIQKELREGYVGRLSKMHPFPWCTWREIDLDHVYTNLRVIPGKKHKLAVTSQKHAQARNIRSSPSYSSDVGTGEQFNCTEDVVDFLWKDPSHKVAFVQGGPGIGKSTFCRRLVHLWAANKLMIPEREFDLVISLEGRNFSGDLKHCIFQQLFPDDFLDDGTLYNCVQKYASNCLLIIDGVDELSDQGKKTALHLARGKRLRGVTLLLAGRPEATKDFMQYVNRHLEVQGFTYDNAVSYIHKYFGSRHTENRDKLLRKIRRDWDVRDLTANPFTTLQLCLIAETSDGEMPSKTDKIMKDVIAITCTRYVKNLTTQDAYKDRISGNVTNEQSGRDCYNVTVDELIRAAKLVAYFGMKMGTLVFNEEELQTVLVEKRIREHLLKSGILSRDFTLARLDTRCTCWFPHKLIQDVLCVSYLAALSPDDLRRELDNPDCVRGLGHNRYISDNLRRKIVDDEPRFRLMLPHIIKHRDVDSFCEAVETVTNDDVKKLLGEAAMNNYQLYRAINKMSGLERLYYHERFAGIFQKLPLPPVLTFSFLLRAIDYHDDGSGFCGVTMSTVLHTLLSDDPEYMYKFPHPVYIAGPPAQQDDNSILPWGNVVCLQDVTSLLRCQHVRTLCVVWVPPIRNAFRGDPLSGLRDRLSGHVRRHLDYLTMMRRLLVSDVPRYRDRLSLLRDWLSRARTNTTLFLVVPRRYHDDYFHLRALDFVKSCQFEHVTVKLCCNRTFHPSEELFKYAENSEKKTLPVCEFRTSLHQLYYDKLSPY